MEVIKDALTNDVMLLSRVLAQILKEQVSPEDFKIIDELNLLSKDVDSAKLDYLMNYINKLTDEQLLLVAKTFNQLINFSQVAERYNKVRCAREEFDLQEPSFQLINLSKAIEDIIAKGIEGKDLYRCIKNLNIEIVLTSNLTQIRRRTLLHKYDKVFKLLANLDDEKLTEPEQERIIEHLCYQVTSIWFTDEIRDSMVKPEEEAKWGLAVMESSLWKAVSSFISDLDYQIQKYTEYPLPLDAAPIKFRTWIGSDKLNNNSVTTKSIKEVYLLGCWSALDLYIRSLSNLYYSLGIKECDETMAKLVKNAEYPYRTFIKNILEKLRNMMFNIEVQLTDGSNFRGPVYNVADEIYDDLKTCYESLVNIGAARIANGELLDIIRRLKCFGISMYSMDIRESKKSIRALVEKIIKNLDNEDYMSWEESKKQKYLLEFLESDKKVVVDNSNFQEHEKDCWDTILLMKENPNWEISGYIVHKVIQPSDILEVMFLFKLANVTDKVPIIPSFDGCLSLKNGVSSMKFLFEQSVFLKRIKGKQEIMLANLGAYKEMGYMAASWGQYVLQEELIKLSRLYGVQLKFCYGTGGGVGRGGGSAHLAITGQPVGSIKNKVAFSFQGEIIHNIFGNPLVAERSLVIYTVATLESILLEKDEVLPEWKEFMDDFAEKSLKSYMELKDRPNFLDFALETTPVQELQDLVFFNKNEVKALADIQSQIWMYSWGQNRLLFPVWAGVNTALETTSKKTIKVMSEKWQYFKSTLGFLEMVFAKADDKIFKYYQENLLEPGLKELSDKLIDEFEECRDTLLGVLKTDKPLGKQPLLDDSIKISYPYLLPLNFIQIEALKRVRALQSYTLNDNLRKALYVSFSGISVAMRNTS